MQYEPHSSKSRSYVCRIFQAESPEFETELAGKPGDFRLISATENRAHTPAHRLGGSEPLPKLFETAGLEFGMDRAILGRVVPAVLERIRELS